MTLSLSLQDFIDDELLRAPLLFDQVLQDTLDAARRAKAPLPALLLQAMEAARVDLGRCFVTSLREQTNAASTTPSRAAPKALALVDEAEVARDVELSRTTKTIADVAEQELRELGAFTSALVGDLHVARSTNPLSAEVYARALSTAALQLPLPRDEQVKFMRHAAMPLAQALRKAFAAACKRLEDAGVKAGTHSTIVIAAGPRVAPVAREHAAQRLAQVRDTMPVPLDEPVPDAPAIDAALRRADELLRQLPETADAPTRARVLDGQRAQLLGSAASRLDQQLIELLARLFDAILGDPTVAPAVQVLLSRLHSAAFRIALRDPVTLDSYGHPLWRFMDHLAFASEMHPRDDDPLRRRLLAYAQRLVDYMAREPRQDAALFTRGLDALAVLVQELFAERLASAAKAIERLGALAPAPDTAHSPIDVATLDTVPADLMLVDEARGAASTELPPLRPGQWVGCFHQGRWRTAQLLWTEGGGALWLFSDVADGSTWAFTRAALERLHAEGLVEELQPQSLVRRAAHQVLLDMTADAR